MEYAIIWTLDGCQYHQSFDDLDAAAGKLSDWADAYPHNTYYLARIIGHLPSTVVRDFNANDAKMREAYAKFNELTRRAFRHGQQYSVIPSRIPQLYGAANTDK